MLAAKKKLNKNIVGMTKSDYVFMTIVHILVFLFTLSCAYPLYYVCIASISDPNEINAGRVLLIPRKINIEGFRFVFQNSEIWKGYLNTIFYAFSNTFLSLCIMFTTGYALSYSDIPGKSFFITMMLIPQFFAGGLVPTYLWMEKLGFVNSIWIMIIPGGCGLGSAAIIRTYMKTSVPWELREAAFIDGCSIQRVFTSIILPLCKPIVAVNALWGIVGCWNSYTGALIYLRNRSLFPLQLILREILIQGKTTSMMSKVLDDEFAKQVMEERLKLAQKIQFSTIIVSTLPLMIMYPFLQKYFVKGIMVGSLKG